MPVFNTAEFLPACIDSILNQSESNWELIAVNDFSTDNSRAVLEYYAIQDDRIQVVDNNEKGIIPALKLGYSISKGKFITRMDSDDLMSTDKLASLKNILHVNGKGTLATGLVNYFSDEGIKAGYKKYELWLNQLSEDESNFNEIYKECVIPSPCWMIHRSDFELCGSFNSEEYPEDYDLVFRFRKAGLNVKTVKRVIHYWRDYAYRTSRTSSDYSDNTFIPLKVKYFLSDDYNHERELILWGAGKKGKSIAKILIKNKILFRWLTNNPKKIGHEIYGVIIQNSEILKEFDKPQIIFCISQKKIESQVFDILNYPMSKNVYHFC